ncbi:MAG TPA: hypothetical protein DDX98_11555 [Bacteroidales bacterium]|nr:hypothetical protein [Bacteroidales bacterium]
MKSTIAILSLIALLFSSCTTKSKQPETLNGTWKSVGSGWILQINDSSRYAFYDVTAISCLPGREGPLEELSGFLSLNQDTLLLQKGVITYAFIRTDNLPDMCSQTSNKENPSNPIYNFEVFAETVKEHYAFMDLNEINWKTLYVAQKEKLNEHSSPADLYLVIEETLEKLNDNHAYLEGDEAVYSELEKIRVPEPKAEGETLPEYGDFQVADMVTKHHLQEEMTRDSWLIQWGKLTNTIGYIQVKSMWLFADMQIPETLINEIGYVDAYVETRHKMFEGRYIEKEVEGVRNIMNLVMNDLEEMEAIVIDVRFNGGGQDAVSFEILSRFIPGRQQVANQQIRYGIRFTDVLPLYIEGSADPFTKPTYVLTSPQTGSAAEAFSIATMAIDPINRIGSATLGAISTALEKKLPNGWTFSISNEIYMDNAGNKYENTGIPVDFELNYSRDRQTFFRSVVNDLKGDKQDILNAIESLKEKNVPKK